MIGAKERSTELKGEAFVKSLSEKALRTVELNYREGTDYIDVDLKNQANAEEVASHNYRGRFLFELLQNASDAIVATEDYPEWVKPDGYRVRLELTDSALVVANDGVPFLEKDVNSIFRWGETSKDPNKTIGYKGIGFKSVLEITESPEVFSRVVQFRFDRKTCLNRVRAIVGRVADLKLPITRFVFPYTVDQVPTPDRDLIHSLLTTEGYATVIRLPLKAEIGQVQLRLDADVDPGLLLFLPGIDRLEVRSPGRSPKTLTRKSVRSMQGIGQDVMLSENDTFVSRWMLFDAPKHPIRNRAIITALNDTAWSRVRRVGFAIALPLDRQGNLEVEATSPEYLYVYFPTTVRTGLRYRIQGDFHIDAARKQISQVAYNDWLSQEIVRFIGETVVPELTQHYRNDARIAQAFVPVGAPEAAAESLCRLIEARLRSCAFVASTIDCYQTPERIMFMPPGASVDVSRFPTYFRKEDLSRRNGGRHFPVSGLERDARTIEFLIGLGAKRLAPGDVFKLLDGQPPVASESDYPLFYDYLWRWREDLRSSDRSEFTYALQNAHCVVVDNGSWIKPQPLLYHAKLRQDTPVMPSAAQAYLVHSAAYDAEGRSGPSYRLLDTLMPPPLDYNAPDIIRNAIRPLFSEKRFRSLSLEQRVEVYRYLFAYWQTRRGAGDPEVEKIKGDVPIPARSTDNRRRDVWLPACQVYLSSDWTGDNRLERLYEGVEGARFLYQIRGLDLSPDEISEWAKFWEWLGVGRTPRVLVEEVNQSALARNPWNRIRISHSHAGTALWGNYISQCQAAYGRCQKHGLGYRQLRRSVALDGFAELVIKQDAVRLELLYEILAENWPDVQRTIPKAEVTCQRQDCPQYARSELIPSFFEYLAKTCNWIAARTEVDGTKRVKLYQPQRCWIVSPGEKAVIRNLIPTPIRRDYRPEYDLFNGFLAIRSIERAGLEDLVDLLRYLPEEYPNPDIAVYSGRRSVPDAIQRCTRWVLERINNILIGVSGGHAPLTQRPPLIAVQGDQARYVPPSEPIFFADRRMDASQWRLHIPFAPIDEAWKDAAHYLGLKFISRHTTETLSPGAELVGESEKLADRFVRARPYLLAVVNQQSGSITEDACRYLSNLRMVVVEDLVVQRSLTVPPYTVLPPDREAQVYLERTTGSRRGSAGRAPVSGTLYVRKGCESNFDVLGGPIANYISVPSLEDAFVILLDRGNKEGRLRYLGMRGLVEADVTEMRAELRRTGGVDEPEPESEDSDLMMHLQRQLLHEPVSGSVPTEPISPAPVATPRPTDATDPDRPVIMLPPLEVPRVEVVMVADSDGTLANPSIQPLRGIFGIGPHNWERDQRMREIYGKRGEQLVFDLELRRLKQFFHDPEAHMRWLRQEGDDTADHDIESKELINGEWVDVIIEVKSTPGRDFRFPMSKDELRCAQRHGDRYQLYRVIDVASAAPQVYVFGNPMTLWKEQRAVIEPRDTYVILPDPRKRA